MSEKKIAKPIALAVGAALASSFAISGTASADSIESPFALSTLNVGYMLVNGEGSCGGDKKGEEEGACGEGSCGGDKKGEEGACGEGSCGGDKDKHKEGEGSCGGDKEDAEGSCGEGSCGGSV